MSKDELLERVLEATQPDARLSYLDTQRELNAISFVWQGRRFRVTTALDVTEQIDAAWSESDAARRMRQRLENPPARSVPTSHRRRAIGARGVR